MELPTGIEPVSLAWKAKAQPVDQRSVIYSQAFVINALEWLNFVHCLTGSLAPIVVQ